MNLPLFKDALHGFTEADRISLGVSHAAQRHFLDTMQAMGIIEKRFTNLESRADVVRPSDEAESFGPIKTDPLIQSGPTPDDSATLTGSATRGSAEDQGEQPPREQKPTAPRSLPAGQFTFTTVDNLDCDL